MFFLSGAAALIYQVVWVRSLTLVFGGSHLAVTAVLSIFMAGLAIGGYLIGRHADKVMKPLRLYGLLEIGIALFALVFAGLMEVYPSIYVPLAQMKDDFHLYLSFIRVLFSVVALIVPTTLMGGTLPVLSRFISDQPKNLRSHLSFLYAFNTLGAVLGTTTAGFFFLRLYSVQTTLYLAIISNALIGLTAILLQNKTTNILTSEYSATAGQSNSGASSQGVLILAEMKSLLPVKLVLWGIGVSGFCALGYEVLWSRILTIVVGASVYSFTTMLIAFLTGIALGSGAYGLMPKILKFGNGGLRRSVFWFGLIQVVIGATALMVTFFIRDLPMNIMRLHSYFQSMEIGLFGVRLWSNFALAFLYMVIPAFFMGVAFPLAGKIYAEYRKVIGGSVGEVLAYNTVGAILGAAGSGFLMIYFFGIEKSLQMLTVINIGFGLVVLSSVKDIKLLSWGIASLAIVALVVLGANPKALRIWDMKYFAIFRSNQLEAFDTPEKIREAVENTDVLYYAEGAESIVSSIKIKGGEQSFLTNGRVESSSHLQGQQHLFTLGHLPMLLNKNPRHVLVVGLGGGMTLGAVSVHPTVQQMTLAEIEPKVLGVARTFENYNHHVLDNPKLRIFFNDGRNFLMTTKEKFDVITADPIHPWFRGAGYLYTTEYFKLASDHLLPGGIICQWLPLYELTPDDLKSVVVTFRHNFRYTMMWLTHYDAEIVGSNSPMMIDEKDLDRRIVEPKVSEDLKRVMMGNATDFLSYFVMGNEGMRAFAEGGRVNTDNNLYLEFSAPFSIGKAATMEANIMAIIKHREAVQPYLLAATDPREREQQEKRWANHTEKVGTTGKVLSIFLGGGWKTKEFQNRMDDLDQSAQGFAPARFLRYEYLAALGREPRLLQKTPLVLSNEKGDRILVEISAVFIPISEEKASVAFVDNNAHVIFGELSVSGHGKETLADKIANEVTATILAIYHQEAVNAREQGISNPMAETTLRKIRKMIVSKEVRKDSP